MKKQTIQISKKIIILIALIALIIFMCAPSQNYAYAAQNNKSAEDKLSDAVEGQLKGINFGELEKILSNLGEEKNLFEGKSFADNVKALLKGEFENKDAFSVIMSIFLGEIVTFMPLLATIIAIAILCSLLTSLQLKQNSQGTSSIIYFACYGAVILSVSVTVLYMVTLTRNTVKIMQDQMNIVFPILLSLMTAIGGTTSVAVYQPMVAILSTFISELMILVILPLFIFSYVFNIVGNINPALKLKKFSDFASSLTKWILGIVFTVFTAFLSVRGITASAYDGISYKTAKYAISKYIPIIGGYLSEGFNLIVAGSVLIKNAVGVTGLLLLGATIVVPIAKIAILILTLKLTAAILEPLAVSGFSEFVGGVAKSLSMLSVIILGVAFMYLITIMLIIFTGNFIWS